VSLSLLCLCAASSHNSVGSESGRGAWEQSICRLRWGTRASTTWLSL